MSDSRGSGLSNTSAGVSLHSGHDGAEAGLLATTSQTGEAAAEAATKSPWRNRNIQVTFWQTVLYGLADSIWSGTVQVHRGVIQFRQSHLRF